MPNTAAVSLRRTIKLKEILENIQNRTYFVAAVTFIVFVILMVGGVIPGYQQVIAQYTENIKLADIIDKASEKLNDMKTLLTFQNVNAQVLNRFSELFPNENIQEDFSKMIFNLGATKEVIVREVTFVEGARSKPLSADFTTLPQVQSQEVAIRVEGSRSKLVAFLDDLENGKKVTNVTSVSLSRKSDDLIGDTIVNNDYVLNLRVEYFYFVVSTTN